MEETTSRVPELLVALADACRVALPDVTVTIGTPTATQMTERTLVIGWPADGPSVTVDEARVDGLGHRYVERAEVSCVASVISGNTEGADALAAQARDMVAAVEAVVKAGIAVSDRTTIQGRQQWFIGQGPTGLAVDLLFVVVAEVLR